MRSERAKLRRVGGNRQLAAWLVRQRREIEQRMVECHRGALPSPNTPEAEALRRLRSFASNALLRGEAAAPALDGLRVAPEPTERLLQAWLEASAAVAGPEGEAVRQALTPLLERFRSALAASEPQRRRRGAPRSSRRRAVAAAIDRLADVFLAVDTATGEVADANPAAASLLGSPRDALLGCDALHLVPAPARAAWWTELEAISEGADSRQFRSALRGPDGRAIEVDVRVTRFATRARTLALLLARPR